MTQNMFQEGLYQVFVKDTPSTSSPSTPPVGTDNEDIFNVRIHRWFGTVVNTRVLVAGYVAAGCLAMEVQRKADHLKVVTLMGLNIFSLLFGFVALLANSISSTERVPLSTKEQRAGSYVAKGSSIAFTVQCFLASVYILFLSWKGLRRYSPTHIQVYRSLSQQNQDETNGPLMEQEEFNL
ncbi:uncharacterized protein si:dkey-30c15.13 isoform X3 [Labrus bergylta]|uniref:uncharacterized protein si:dkey-30c15.13 isoform X3 n=1 Tax=Labrus bergylta TaxID=56723 RepID=UPI0009B34EB5|nr:uncharacterized protein LOC109978217 isoform X3 [Labrus bergylta]